MGGDAHARFGRLPWADLFRPAIYYARNGFPVTEIIHEHWKDSYATLNLDENGRRVFLRDGMAPATGDIFKNPGSNCSPAEMLTGFTVYGSAVSSRKIVSLCPLGVVQ